MHQRVVVSLNSSLVSALDDIVRSHDDIGYTRSRLLRDVIVSYVREHSKANDTASVPDVPLKDKPHITTYGSNKSPICPACRTNSHEFCAHGEPDPKGVQKTCACKPCREAEKPLASGRPS